MTLVLHSPQRSLETLRALAASGSSRFARKAQAELLARTTAALASALHGSAEGIAAQVPADKSRDAK